MSDSRNQDLKEKNAKLLRQVRSLKVDTGSSSEEDATLSALKNLPGDLSLLARSLSKFRAGLGWVYQNIILQFAFLAPVFKTLWFAYRGLWEWFCHPEKSFLSELLHILRMVAQNLYCRLMSLVGKEKKFCAVVRPLRRGKFSKTRAGVFISLTVLLLAWPLRIPLLRDLSFALCYELPYDLTRMSVNLVLHGGSFAEDRLFLNGKNEIDHQNNIWSVSGCQNRPDCPPAEAVYFRIKPSVAHMTWSLLRKQQIFIPDDLAAVIPNVPAECNVKSYGARLRILRWMQSYPVLLDVRCEVIAK
jgi:hypothetical protein